MNLPATKRSAIPRLRSPAISKEVVGNISRAVLGILLLLFLTAFMIAIGYDVMQVILNRTELQAESDALAIQKASSLNFSADYSKIRSPDAEVQTIAGRTKTTIAWGNWDPQTRSFISNQKTGRAVQVRLNQLPGGSKKVPLLLQTFFQFFPFTTAVTSIATPSPRDIVICVDLSGAMNDDSEPAWSTAALNNDYPNPEPIGTRFAQSLYEDLSLGPFPGESEYLAEQLTENRGDYTYASLARDNGPLATDSIDEAYRIKPEDSEIDRKRKVYSYLIDHQLARLMPDALPRADSKTAYPFWSKYLDYVIRPYPDDPSWPVGRGTLPPGQGDDRLAKFNNPARNITIQVPDRLPKKYENQIGYRTYVQFLLDLGRDLRPSPDEYSPLSIHSKQTAWHSEKTASGGILRFPPRTEPMHSIRRSLVNAIESIRQQNGPIPDTNIKDRISIVTFDRLESGGANIVLEPTTNYESAMRAAASLQAAGDRQLATPIDAGLLAAKKTIETAEKRASPHSAKLLLLISGSPTGAYQTDTQSINSAMRMVGENPDYYHENTSLNEINRSAKNAALIAAADLKTAGWHIYPIGIGQQTDTDFLDRLARISKWESSSKSAIKCKDPTQYEAQLTAALQTILSHPIVHLAP
jgi:putative Tad-like protein involved in Flp pilus assembly